MIFYHFKCPGDPPKSSYTSFPEKINYLWYWWIVRQNPLESKIYVSCSGGTSPLWPTLTTRVDTAISLWKHSPGNDVTLQSIKRPERLGLSKFNLEILRSSTFFNTCVVQFLWDIRKTNSRRSFKRGSISVYLFFKHRNIYLYWNSLKSKQVR